MIRQRGDRALTRDREDAGEHDRADEQGGPTGRAESHARISAWGALGQRMSGVNMRCAFGDPGNISHGPSFCGTLEIPVDASVANGM